MINNAEQPKYVPDLEGREGLTGKYDAKSMSLRFSPENLKGEVRAILDTAFNYQGLGLDDQLCSEVFFEAVINGLDEDQREDAMKKISSLLADMAMQTETDIRKVLAKELVTYVVSIS